MSGIKRRNSEGESEREREKAHTGEAYPVKKSEGAIRTRRSKSMMNGDQRKENFKPRNG